MQLNECVYCGTKNTPVCCDESAKIFRARIFAMLRAGDPSDAALMEIAEACVKQAESDPRKIQEVVKYVLGDRIDQYENDDRSELEEMCVDRRLIDLNERGDFTREHLVALLKGGH